jgi:hypothetical protein
MSDDAAKVTALQQEYTGLLHAMQTGVLIQINAGSGETTPKHLRVGVNSALIQNSSLATLLMRKGVITELEYWETQVELWRNEVRDYEATISQALGRPVKLR